MKRQLVAGLSGIAGLLSISGLAACTATTGNPEPVAGGYRLVSFDSCEDTLDGLRTAARRNLAAWGIGRYGYGVDEATGSRADAPQTATGGAPAPDAAGAAGAADAAGKAATPEHSTTNNHEAGVDEPDLVKTDGRRIITVQGGVLRVVDVAGRAQVTRLDVRSQARRPGYDAGYEFTDMLVAGDKVLLVGAVGDGYYPTRSPEPVPDALPSGGPDAAPEPQLTLVDLAGTPRVVGRYTMTGNVVDARQVGSTVRVVMRSSPRIERPDGAATKDAYTAAMMAAIDRADLSNWLPTYRVEDGTGTVADGRVDCASVAHPAEFTASSMLTVLTFDLTRDTLGNGEPLSIAADGDTVYSNGPSLYVASDQRWRLTADTSGSFAPPRGRTEIYRFDTSKPGRPAFVAGGAVDGWLLNQYSMSEWNGHLRVATTTGTPVWGPTPASGVTSESTVYVLRADGGRFTQVGKVGGLGRNERIYSVRFAGGTGYVVTFRQTDPLYAVDLRDPAKPAVTGELKITGYSAYLHPAGDNRLLGIGQEANGQGRVQGTQISLFDVGDPAKPARLAQYLIRGGHSEAEFDPHAFLYWPKTGLLVVPLLDRRSGGSGALALKVTDGGITELGFVEHPDTNQPYAPGIRRSLVIGDTLWTVSARGLLASDAGTAVTQSWVPFT